MSSNRMYYYSSIVDEYGKTDVNRAGYMIESDGEHTQYYVLDNNDYEYKPVNKDAYNNYIKQLKCPMMKTNVKKQKCPMRELLQSFEQEQPEKDYYQIPIKNIPSKIPIKIIPSKHYEDNSVDVLYSKMYDLQIQLDNLKLELYKY